MRAGALCAVILISLRTAAWAQVGSLQVPVGAPAVVQIASVGNIQQTLRLPDIQLTPSYQSRDGCRPTLDDPSCKAFDYELSGQRTNPAMRYPGSTVAERLRIATPAQVWLKICPQNMAACRTAPKPRELVKEKDTFEHFDGIEPNYFLPRQIFYLTWSLFPDDNALSSTRSTLFQIIVVK